MFKRFQNGLSCEEDHAPNDLTAKAPLKTRPIPLLLVAALFLLWSAPSLISRDLWKADEPYSFGLVNHIVKTGDWVVPTLAGEPFMEKPPLFYLTAAGFAKLLSPWMRLHDAARLAAPFYLLLTALFVGLAARELLGSKAVAVSIVLLIGSVGLQVTSRKLITDNAMIAGIAMSLYGLAVCRRRPLPGGFLLGTGAGIGFLSKGLLAPGLLGLTALAMPVFFSEWRVKAYVHALLAAVAAALPWLIIWPLALYLRSYPLFVEWFWYQNLGRFLGYAHVGREFSHAFYLMHLPWFALPTLPLALWAIWHGRRSLLRYSGVSLPLVSFLVMFLVLSLSSSIRNIYALPMLLPLALLAAAGAESLPEPGKRALNRAGLWLFGILGVVLWVGWFALMTGVPAALARELHVQQPDYTPSFHPGFLVLACFYTVFWIFGILGSRRCEYRELINWTVGMTFVWGLCMTIWLPWIDAGSGYCSMFLSMKQKIPARCSYILAQGLGESERALVEYYTGILPRRISQKGGKLGDCDILLIQSGSERQDPPTGAEWQFIGEWWRPSDPLNRPKEMFTLLQRKDGKRNCQ